MWNIVVGIVFIIGGLTGQMALIFTNSPEALAVVGFLMLAWGVYQVVQQKKQAG